MSPVDEFVDRGNHRASRPGEVFVALQSSCQFIACDQQCLNARDGGRYLVEDKCSHELIEGSALPGIHPLGFRWQLMLLGGRGT